jgi:hypothetical protein
MRLANPITVFGLWICGGISIREGNVSGREQEMLKQ